MEQWPQKMSKYEILELGWDRLYLFVAVQCRNEELRPKMVPCGGGFGRGHHNGATRPRMLTILSLTNPISYPVNLAPELFLRILFPTTFSSVFAP